MSRPQSRNTHRRGGGGGFGNSNSFDMGYSSPEDTVKSRPMSRYGFNHLDASFVNDVSTLPLPRSEDDSDEEELDLNLVHERTTTSSTVSMEIHERMEALQRNNEELGRKLMEAERTLQNKLMEHETELEETHMRLEELRSELSLSNREEKELRAKDVRIFSHVFCCFSTSASLGIWRRLLRWRQKSRRHKRVLIVLKLRTAAYRNNTRNNVVRI